jgi:hypothetical protein
MIAPLAPLEFRVKVVITDTIVSYCEARTKTTDEVINEFHPFVMALVMAGLQTPYNQLRENTHFCTSFVDNVPRIVWLDDTGTALTVDGIKITLDDICYIAKTGIDSTRNHLEKVVLDEQN